MGCPACGEPVGEDSDICPHCGANMTAADSAAGQTVGGGDSPERTSLGLEPNLAGAFSYSLTFVSGIVFYYLAADEFVRFHAAQSLVVFGGLFSLNLLMSILQSVVAAVPGVGPTLSVVLGALSSGLTLLAFGLWILLMVAAFRGRQFALPFVEGVVTDLASRRE